MHKKTYLLSIILALFISSNIFSQKRGSRKKIKALKVSYITDKLNLTEQEAAKFWPIYNKFESKRYELYHTKRSSLKKKIKALGGIDKLTEKDAEVFAKKILAIEKENYEANVRYQKELHKFISYKRIVKLQIIERDFNRRMFRRLKGQKAKKIKKGTH